jgi:hypothetical protein
MLMYLPPSFFPGEGIFDNKQTEILPSKTAGTICILNARLMEIEVPRVS